MAKFSFSIFKLLKQAATEWITLGISRLGAALAFYALFAIAPLFVIVLGMAGIFIQAAAARGELYKQLSGMIGNEASASVQALVSAVGKPKHGVWETILATGLLFIGATGLFVHLQHALNAIWGVRRAPNHGLMNFLKDRLLSLALIAGVGLLLLLSLILDTVLSPAGKFMAGLLPAQQSFVQAVNFAISFVVIALLFAMFFKLLPDVKIPWRDVRMGALMTALFFCAGKFLLALYLGRGATSTAYGAAGSLVIVLLWVYYSAQILMIGAKFTQLYSRSRGSRLEPLRGAQLVTV